MRFWENLPHPGKRLMIVLSGKPLSGGFGERRDRRCRPFVDEIVEIKPDRAFETVQLAEIRAP
jgi:hypothetical protein